MPLQKRNFRSYNPAFNFSTPADRKRTNTVPLLSQSAGNVNRDIFRAPSEVVIDQVSIVVSVALVADAVNYWQLDVKLISAGLAGTVGPSILTAPMAITTGLAAQTNLDLGVVSGGVTIGPNDVLQLQISKFANPGDLEDLLAVVDWEVTGMTTTTSTSTTTTTSTTTSTSTSSTTSSSTTVSTSTTLT